jgi:hypothetical protein
MQSNHPRSIWLCNTLSQTQYAKALTTIPAADSPPSAVAVQPNGDPTTPDRVTRYFYDNDNRLQATLDARG